jgi:hypothetical protein
MLDTLLVGDPGMLDTLLVGDPGMLDTLLVGYPGMLDTLYRVSNIPGSPINRVSKFIRHSTVCSTKSLLNKGIAFLWQLTLLELGHLIHLLLLVYSL